MTNLRKINLSKKITAVFMTVIMALGIFNFTALAATGTVTAERTGSYGDYDVKFTYTNVGNTYIQASGRFSKFETEGDKSYMIEFSPAVGSGASIIIFNTYTKDEAINIIVPQVVSGMPTILTTYATLPEGEYSVKVSSSLHDTIASGTVKILGVNSVMG